MDSLGQRFQTKWFQTSEMGALSTELEQATGKREMGNPWPSKKQGHRWWEVRMVASVLGKRLCSLRTGEAIDLGDGRWLGCQQLERQIWGLNKLQASRFSGCV